MSIGAVQMFRLVRCLSKASIKSSSILTKETVPRSFHRVGNRFSSQSAAESSSTNPSQVEGTQKTSTVCIEAEGYTEKIGNVSNLLGLSRTDPESLKTAFVHKSYLTSKASSLKKNHKHNEHLSHIGFQTAKRYLSELLLKQFPSLSPQELWDIQIGVLEYPHHLIIKRLQLKELVAYTTPTALQDAVMDSFMSLIGLMYINEGSEKTKQFLSEHIVAYLDEEILSVIIKGQHPKYMLKQLANFETPLTTRFMRKKANKLVKVGVFREAEECISVGYGTDPEIAEKKACGSALFKLFSKETISEFSFSYQNENFEPEGQIDMGLFRGIQRVITMTKERGMEFGFNIKGGERKKLKNREWLEYNYFSPIFIYSIQPGGLADSLGTLKEGDLILAVNDKNFQGLDHLTAVKVLKEATGTVTLTVKNSKEVLLTDKVESEYKKMKKRERLSQLTSDTWIEWHQAQADKYPEKYADILQLKENEASQ